jgi:hypothetical protein
VTITTSGKSEERFVLVREANSVAAFDPDGGLIARAGDGPDGEPSLLAGVRLR